MPKKPKFDVYEVEVVLAARINDEGGWDYLVKWWGYPESDNSWEPEGNIHQCERLLESFWYDVGRDDNDHPIGYQVNATREWIRKEKQYFARVFAPYDSDSDEQLQMPKKSRTPTTPRSNKKSKQANTVSDVNIQPRSPRKLKSSIKPGSGSKAKRRNIISDSSDSDHIRVERRKRLTITIPPRAHFVTSVVAPAVTRQEPSTNAVEQDNIEDPPSSPDSLFSKKSSSETSPSESQLEINPVEDRFFTHRSPEPMAPTDLPDLDNAQAHLVAEIAQISSNLHLSNGDDPIHGNIISESLSISCVSDEPVVRDVSNSPVLRRAAVPVPKQYAIPKKWKWVGALLVNTGGDHVKRLSVVSLTDLTADPPNGLSFNIVLPTTVHSIEITRMLNIADLDPLLSACGPFRQVAKLAAENINDRELFCSLASLMDDRQQVAVGPLLFENKEVASVIIFPSSLPTLWPRFNVPDDLQQTGQFIATLIPWTMTPAQYDNYGIHSTFKSFAPPEFKYSTTQAIRCLVFPRALRKYMMAPGHPYVVWWSPSDGTTSAPGLETTLLLKIMKTCRAQKVEADDNSLRVVFVHVGALESLHRLSTITKRRQHPEIHFFSYGSHHSVPSEQWGVRAIYPLGGIVTFTADALLEDPIGAAQLMSRIALHPFWDCYLLPSAVGVAVRFLCEDGDPLLEFQAGHCILDDIFRLVADGQVALLRAPHGRGASLDWVHWQLSLLASTPSDLLEECLRAFSTQYANTPDNDLLAALHTEIAEDFLCLQSSPSIIENYRQYVVIKATSTGDCSGKHGGLVEWTTLDDFDTQDGFLQTPDSLVSV